jgi:hypothetical protein
MRRIDLEREMGARSDLHFRRTLASVIEKIRAAGRCGSHFDRPTRPGEADLHTAPDLNEEIVMSVRVERSSRVLTVEGNVHTNGGPKGSEP